MKIRGLEESPTNNPYMAQERICQVIISVLNNRDPTEQSTDPALKGKLFAFR